MRKELIELSDLFGELDQATTEYFDPKRQTMGLTDEMIEEAFDRLIAGEPDGPSSRNGSPRSRSAL